jgi:hypothetical protein
MALDRWQRTLLLSHANRYIDKNYRVGLCDGKAFLKEYSPQGPETEFDGISIIPEQIACVDFDCDFKDLGWGRDLPVTWKEKTPRGWHLFYKLPEGKFEPRIHFKPDVDLLTKPKGVAWQQKLTQYLNKSSKTTRGPDHWGEHILCSPTPGYRCVWPNEALDFDTQLTPAPTWLIDTLGAT